MQPFPEKLILIAMLAAGALGVLILIAPNFGQKPKATFDGWQFPVKPTCLLLYYLALAGGIAAVAFGALQLLRTGNWAWLGWPAFAFGFLLVPVVLVDWPEPLIVDEDGLVEGGYAPGRIKWQELSHIRRYRIRCDRGVVIEGADGKRLVIAEIAYDSRAVLDCLLKKRAVPYSPLKEVVAVAAPLLSDRPSQS